ncbi:hypothetical protein DIPPA_17774 [Diplonema papillatum]|nr:hypothetical protein DIPPA_17774 [Diplonema papillatum]
MPISDVGIPSVPGNGGAQVGRSDDEVVDGREELQARTHIIGRVGVGGSIDASVVRANGG